MDELQKVVSSVQEDVKRTFIYYSFGERGPAAYEERMKPSYVRALRRRMYVENLWTQSLPNERRRFRGCDRPGYVLDQNEFNGKRYFLDREFLLSGAAEVREHDRYRFDRYRSIRNRYGHASLAELPDNQYVHGVCAVAVRWRLYLASRSRMAQFFPIPAERQQLRLERYVWHATAGGRIVRYVRRKRPLRPITSAETE